MVRRLAAINYQLVAAAMFLPLCQGLPRASGYRVGRNLVIGFAARSC